MSVLLEALKKAAEEKQRKQSGEETSLPENKETPSVQPETALVENNAASIKSTDSQAIEEGPAFKIATEKDVSSSAHSKEKVLDLETNLALHDSSFSKKMVLDENTEGKKLVGLQSSRENRVKQIQVLLILLHSLIRRLKKIGV
ncbi:hypothetical protein GHNINEIG_00677 [Hydrogenovibrio crunogenus]|uniref:Uncharacterized protein n=1 Tax=Hydrogenovibrio crunogenus TaxID=39765 RepID=A0A4P7NYQ8_9GAMM|nr:hypothetical protein [Hydrogenovibrio crunogenus]QBZ82645.1 hypothetical protein GHNINEIG_00677 [Hydrogenovibrio crunogenus]